MLYVNCEDYKDDAINLIQYFCTSAYSGYGDNDGVGVLAVGVGLWVCVLGCLGLWTCSVNCEDYKDNAINLMQYFCTSAHSGYGDNDGVGVLAVGVGLWVCVLGCLGLWTCSVNCKDHYRWCYQHECSISIHHHTIHWQQRCWANPWGYVGWWWYALRVLIGFRNLTASKVYSGSHIPEQSWAWTLYALSYVSFQGLHNITIMRYAHRRGACMCML